MSLTAITRSRAAALLFVGAALSSIGLPGRAQNSTTIHLGILPNEAGAEAYYAKDMGFFESAGLDADIQAMQAGSPAIAAAMASGAIDIGYGTLDVLASLHQKSVPLVVIAPASEYVFSATARSAALVLSSNSTVRQAKDLNGKIISVPALRGFPETASRVWIDQNGGDSSTVKFIEITQPATPAALEANRIDAAYVSEPFNALALKNGHLLAYLLAGISKHFIVSGWYTTPQWANEHLNVVKRFVSVMHETAVWANNNPRPSGAILAKYTKIDPTVIANMVRAHYCEQMSATLMQPLIDASAKYDGFSTFPAQELLYVPSR